LFVLYFCLLSGRGSAVNRVGQVGGEHHEHSWGRSDGGKQKEKKNDNGNPKKKK